MRSISIFTTAILCTSIFMAPTVVAKDGIQATVHTTIPSDAQEGSQLEVSWTLADQDSGRPFDAPVEITAIIEIGG